MFFFGLVLCHDGTIFLTCVNTFDLQVTVDFLPKNVSNFLFCFIATGNHDDFCRLSFNLRQLAFKAFTFEKRLSKFSSTNVFEISKALVCLDDHRAMKLILFCYFV